MTKQLFTAMLVLATGLCCCKKSNEAAPTPVVPGQDFMGKGGIYFLGSADIPVPAAAFTNPSLAGIVIRVKWQSLETAPGVFNWSFIDNEISRAKAANKKVSIQPLGYPSWVISSLGATSYNYIDKNPLHGTFGDTLQGLLAWDPIYLSRIENMIRAFASKYAQDTTVTYFNLIAGQVSRQLPDSIVTASGPLAFYTAFSYKADSVVKKMNALLDTYMSLFPKTPLWNSIDYVSFEPRASGKQVNYLASLYVAYGVTKYPNRFGCWREDLSACNPQLLPASGNQWWLLYNHPERTGAQMLWSVQDGPTRMNKCGILPNTKQVVFDSSMNNGLRLGMRYFEVYGADLQDATLSANVDAFHQSLHSRFAY